MTGWFALLWDLAGLGRGSGALRTHERRQRWTLFPLQDRRGTGASPGRRQVVSGGLGAVFQGPLRSEVGGAAVDAVSDSLVHPEHLGVAGGVGAEGALVAWKAFLVQVEGGGASTAGSPHTKIHRGPAGLEGEGSRQVSSGGGGVVQPLEKSFLQLGETAGSVYAGAGTGTGTEARSVLRAGRMLDTDVS